MAQRKRPDPRSHRGIADLPHGLVEALVRVIGGDADVAETVVFGSYARGEAGPRSDLDLCLLFRGDESQTVDVVARADALIYPVMRRFGLEYDLVGFPVGMLGGGRPRGRRPLLDRIEAEGVRL